MKLPSLSKLTLTKMISIGMFFSLVGCNSEDSGVPIKKKSGDAVSSGDPKATEDPTDKPIDLVKTCGLPPAGSDPDATLLDLRLKSYPFTASGSQLGMSYRITLSAEIAILFKQKSPGSRSLKINTENIEFSTTSPLIKALGTGAAKKKIKELEAGLNPNSQAEKIPLGQWLNLVTEEGQFKDLLCAIPPGIVKDVSKFEDGKESEIQWLPVQVDAVNPLAPRETLEKEIGSGRTFNITAKVIKNRDGLKPGDYPVTVTVRPITPNFSMSTGQTHSADIAYEMTTDGAVDPSFKKANPFKKRMQYYINTKLHTFEAIVSFTDEVVGGTKIQPQVLIRQ